MILSRYGPKGLMRRAMAAHGQLQPFAATGILLE